MIELELPSAVFGTGNTDLRPPWQEEDMRRADRNSEICQRRGQQLGN